MKVRIIKKTTNGRINSWNPKVHEALIVQKPAWDTLPKDSPLRMISQMLASPNKNTSRLLQLHSNGKQYA